VNTTNRIQGLNKHLKTQIIATHETVRDVPNLIVRELGNFKLVGKSKIINLYEIIDFKTNSTSDIQTLLSNFILALTEFKNGEVGLSLQKFIELLEQFPNDGPSLFYKNYCEHIIKNNTYVKSTWSGTIDMKEK
jgi:adenylate cyclase